VVPRPLSNAPWRKLHTLRECFCEHKSLSPKEIARMLGGVKITDTTRKHAAEMLGLRR